MRALGNNPTHAEVSTCVTCHVSRVPCPGEPADGAGRRGPQRQAGRGGVYPDDAQLRGGDRGQGAGGAQEGGGAQTRIQVSVFNCDIDVQVSQ